MKTSRVIILVGLFFAVLWLVATVLTLAYGNVIDTRLLAPLALGPILIGTALVKKEKEAGSQRPPRK